MCLAPASRRVDEHFALRAAAGRAAELPRVHRIVGARRPATEIAPRFRRRSTSARKYRITSAESVARGRRVLISFAPFTVTFCVHSLASARLLSPADLARVREMFELGPDSVPADSGREQVINISIEGSEKTFSAGVYLRSTFSMRACGAPCLPPKIDDVPVSLRQRIVIHHRNCLISALPVPRACHLSRLIDRLALSRPRRRFRPRRGV